MTAVSVTAADILHGERHQITLCPVALATKRCTGADIASACEEVIRLFFGAEPALRFDTPNSVKSFIRDFDNKLTVAPFEFEIPMEIEQTASLTEGEKRGILADIEQAKRNQAAEVVWVQTH